MKVKIQNENQFYYSDVLLQKKHKQMKIVCTV